MRVPVAAAVKEWPSQKTELLQVRLVGLVAESI
jgi:hypothetical protein